MCFSKLGDLVYRGTASEKFPASQRGNSITEWIDKQIKRVGKFTLIQLVPFYSPYFVNVSPDAELIANVVTAQIASKAIIVNIPDSEGVATQEMIWITSA